MARRMGTSPGGELKNSDGRIDQSSALRQRYAPEHELGPPAQEFDDQGDVMHWPGGVIPKVHAWAGQVDPQAS